MGERAHTPGRGRPILFSAPMVRALLDGRKTQTRRVLGQFDVFRRDDGTEAPVSCLHIEGEPLPRVTIGNVVTLKKLKAAVGDRLWVREAWAHYQTVNHIRRSHGGAFSEVSDGLAGYRADGHDTIEDFRDHVRLMSGCDLEAVEINGNRWRPSIHMPRWASRLTLTVTDVRVQRLQDISEEDAVAEGIEPEEGYWRDYLMPVTQICVRAADSYRTLWDSINGAGSWDANPWVAAYAFTVERRNIDAPATAAKTGGA